MALAVVQSRSYGGGTGTGVNNGNFSNLSNISLTFGSDVTSGNTIIVFGGAWQSGGWSGSVADNKGNTYTQLVSAVPAEDGKGRIWYCANVTGGASFQVTLTQSSAYGAFGAIEVSGGVLSELGTANTNTGTSTAPAGTTDTITSQEYIACGIAVFDAFDEAWTDPTGYTQVCENQDSSGAQAVHGCYKIATGTAETITWGRPNSAAWRTGVTLLGVSSAVVAPIWCHQPAPVVLAH